VSDDRRGRAGRLCCSVSREGCRYIGRGMRDLLAALLWVGIVVLLIVLLGPSTGALIGMMVFSVILVLSLAAHLAWK
jgi:hypothetical protein